MKLQTSAGPFPSQSVFTTTQRLAHAMSIRWCLCWEIVSQPWCVLHEPTTTVAVTQVFHHDLENGNKPKDIMNWC